MGKLWKNYIYNICYQILVLIAPIITAPYLARVLGANYLGISNYVVTVAGVFTTIGLLGSQNYAIREIAYKKSGDELEKVFYELYATRLILGVITIAIYIAYISISKYPDLMWIELMYVIALFIDPCWFYIGMEDMGKAVARNFFAKVANVIGIFVLVRNQQDYVKYIFLLSCMTLVASLLAIPHLWSYFRIRLCVIPLRAIKRHLLGSIQLLWPQVATMIYLSADKILLENLISSSAVAYYDQAEKIVKIPLTFITVLSTVMMPRLANQFASGNTKRVQDYLITTIRFSSLLAFPMMFGVAGIASKLIPWYLGEEFSPVIQAIWVLSPIIVLTSLVGISGDQYLVATKQTNIMTLSYFCAAASNVLVDLLLIPKYSIVGAAIGTIVAYAVSLLIQYRTLLKRMKLLYELLMSCLYLAKAIPMVIVVLILSRFLPASWMTTLVQILAGGITYFLTLIVLKDKMLKSLFANVQKLLKQKG